MASCLILTDSPNLPTGMAKVGREIGRQLIKHGHRVSQLGWFASPNIEKWKEWSVYTSNNMYYGQDIFDSVISKTWPDIVLSIGDQWMTNYIANSDYCRSRSVFQWISYTPIDGESYGGGIPISWKSSLRDADRIVAYTQYGKNAVLKTVPEVSNRIDVINHGTDLSMFKPYSKEKCLQIRRNIGIPDDVVIFLMVARNQFRKNIPEFCKAWRKFMDNGNTKKKALFWPHMCFKDQMGWHLDEVFDICKMNKEIMYLPDISQSMSNLNLLSEEKLVEIYNLSDVIVTCGGEGWGFSTTEGMACKKPILGLNHSATGELVKDTGMLFEAQNYITGAHSTERPVPNIDDLAEKLDLLYSNPKLREDLAQKGYDFVKGISWGKVGDDWDKLIKKVMNPFSEKVICERIA